MDGWTTRGRRIREWGADGWVHGWIDDSHHETMATTGMPFAGVSARGQEVERESLHPYLFYTKFGKQIFNNTFLLGKPFWN